MSDGRRALLLAGDVGATKTNLAFFTAEGGALDLRPAQTFLNADYGALAEIVQAFSRAEGAVAEAACFGVAGPVADGRTRMPNLDWSIDAEDLARTLGVARVVLLNDLEATAHGVPTLAPDRFVVLNEGVGRPDGDAALIAAGTGLGEAILRREGGRYRVWPSEAGHADFAPIDPEEATILGRLWKRFGHVSYERVVSGRGLHDVYDVLDVEEAPHLADRIASAEDPSALIAQTALAGTSERCVRALDVLVRSYGAEAGNLALRALATGGIYVGGGIAPKILPKLQDGTFMRAFCDKGRFTDWMRRIPVKVILDPTTALRGAAAYLAGVYASSNGGPA